MAVAELPLASVAVQVTTVAPSGNSAGASLPTTGAGSTRSLTAGRPRATAVPGPVASTVTGGGAVIEGGVVSSTVTSCVAVAELPLASVAVQVTTVVPGGNSAGASFVTAGAGSRASLTTGEPRPTAVSGLVASAVTGGGAVIEGGVVSITCPANKGRTQGSGPLTESSARKYSRVP